MTFLATTLSIDSFKGPIDSAWSLVAPGNRLVLRLLGTQQELTVAGVDCEPAQEASYTVSLSPDGTVMTLAPLGDLCPARAAVLAGDWTRWPCPNPKSTCKPELTPGKHQSPFVSAVPPGEQALPSTYLAAFNFAVPPGWSLIDNRTIGQPNDPYSKSIYLLPDVAAHSQDPNCRDAIEPGVGATAAELAQWLASLPGLVTTTPTPIEIGGYGGVMLDLTVAQGWTIPCREFFSDPVRAVFTFANRVLYPNDYTLIREYLQDDDHMRYILLDLGSGHNLLIEVRAPDQASWDEFIPAAMPIVDSFEFVR
jgi:hypothetical protein